MVLQRIAILVGSVKELLDLVLELARLVVHRHEHDFLSKRVALLSTVVSLSFFLVVAEFCLEEALGLFDLLDGSAFRRVDNSDDWQLWVSVFEVN